MAGKATFEAFLEPEELVGWRRYQAGIKQALYESRHGLGPRDPSNNPLLQPSSAGLSNTDSAETVPSKRDALDIMMVTLGKQGSPMKPTAGSNGNSGGQHWQGLLIHKSTHRSSNALTIRHQQPPAGAAEEALAPLRRSANGTGHILAPLRPQHFLDTELDVDSAARSSLPRASLPRLGSRSHICQALAKSDGGLTDGNCTERGSMVRSQANAITSAANRTPENEIDQLTGDFALIARTSRPGVTNALGAASRFGSLQRTSAPGLGTALQPAAAPLLSPLSNMVEKAESARSEFLRLVSGAQDVSTRTDRPSFAGVKATQGPQSRASGAEATTVWSPGCALPDGRSTPSRVGRGTGAPEPVLLRSQHKRVAVSSCSQLPDLVPPTGTASSSGYSRVQVYDSAL
jgi:hypothetical protein